ncbi:OsmC family protein [Robiginitalea sp. IMCC44478]|uniref:OsmC family protein n=1 Tax=Robiginitalea sp. IMCC44478 TaxID=3459122 RepID=UPI004043566C
MATQIKIKNIPEGYQSIISAGKHTIIGDEPINSKGTDLGMSPTELVLAGISMCKVATIRNVARRKGLDIGDVNANLRQVVKRTAEGTFKTIVDSEIDIEGDITEDERRMLIDEADNCYVTRVIRGDWEINPSQTLEPSLS